MRMQQLHDDVWTFEDETSSMGVRFPVRMNVIRFESNQLLVHSPIELNIEIKSKIAELGEPRFVIAPNYFHSKFCKSFTEHFPKAQLLCAPGLEKKLKHCNFEVLDEQKTYPWQPSVQHFLVAGMPRLNEFVFYHAASKILFVCDFIFQLPRPEKLWERLLWGSAGIAFDEPSQSRLFRFLRKDKALYNETLTKLRALDIKKIAVAHGPIVEGHKLPKALGLLDKVS